MEEALKRIVDAVKELFEKLKSIVKKFLSIFNFRNPNFKHDWKMATQSKKLRVRKKYMKKVLMIAN